jgi:hypothetical protein
VTVFPVYGEKSGIGTIAKTFCSFPVRHSPPPQPESAPLLIHRMCLQTGWGWRGGAGSFFVSKSSGVLIPPSPQPKSAPLFIHRITKFGGQEKFEKSKIFYVQKRPNNNSFMPCRACPAVHALRCMFCGACSAQRAQ